MRERRKDLRYRAVALRAALLLDDGSQPLVVRDVSRSGICLLHSAALPAGDQRRVELMLELGDEQFSEPVQLPMRIVWSTPLPSGEVQLGAAFDQLDVQQKQALSSILYFLSRDVALDDRGRPNFRTGLVPAIPVEDGK
jgi:hypothetical protein